MGPLSVDDELIASLHVGDAAGCRTLRDLSLPCFVSQLPAVNAWLEALQVSAAGGARAGWPLLRRVLVVEAGVSEESVVLLDRSC